MIRSVTVLPDLTPYSLNEVLHLVLLAIALHVNFSLPSVLQLVVLPAA